VDRTIPIQNVYYMFCYAWQHCESGPLVQVGPVEDPTLPNLLASILVRGTEQLLRRGFDRGYVEANEDLSTIRGRLQINESIKRTLFLKEKIACSFDEFEYDIPANQILKATMWELGRFEGVDADLRRRLLQLAGMFNAVSNVSLSPLLFRQIRLHRNNRAMHFLMRVCEFVHQTVFPEKIERGRKFPDILRDEKRMARVFEEFIRNFFKTEQSAFAVKIDHIQWQGTAINESDIEYLPIMKTDLTLRSVTRTVVVDAKYYTRPLQESEFGKKTVQSTNLYQLFSYLKNLEGSGGIDVAAEGILVYPEVDQRFDLKFKIQGHHVRAVSLDLCQDWQLIKKDLLAFLNP